VLRLQVAERADCAGEFADSHVLCHSIETSDVALHLRVPVEELKTESGRLGMNAMGTADSRGMFELHRSLFEHSEQRK
jgi:hypothetical protein